MHVFILIGLKLFIVFLGEYEDRKLHLTTYN